MDYEQIILNGRQYDALLFYQSSMSGDVPVLAIKNIDRTDVELLENLLEKHFGKPIEKHGHGLQPWTRKPKRNEDQTLQQIMSNKYIQGECLIGATLIDKSNRNNFKTELRDVYLEQFIREWGPAQPEKYHVVLTMALFAPPEEYLTIAEEFVDTLLAPETQSN